MSRCVYTSVLKRVLRRTHAGSERVCAKATPCASKTPCATQCLSETPSASPCMDESSCTSETPSASPCEEETPIVEETPCASGVVAGVPACVLPGTPCVKGAPQAEETTCAREAARVCEPPRVCETPRVSAPVRVSGKVCESEARCVSDRPCVRKTACVRSLYTWEMSVAMCEHAAASPVVSVNGIVCSMGLAARGSVSARVAWRRRLRLWRDKCRVAAVVVNGTVPGLHGRARVVRAVPRTRPPRARLRE